MMISMISVFLCVLNFVANSFQGPPPTKRRIQHTFSSKFSGNESISDMEQESHCPQQKEGDML